MDMAENASSYAAQVIDIAIITNNEENKFFVLDRTNRSNIRKQFDRIVDITTNGWKNEWGLRFPDTN